MSMGKSCMRAARGGRRTDPKYKCSYVSDHRPWVFDPHAGKRVRPQEQSTEAEDCRRGQSSSDSWQGAPTAADGAEEEADGAWGDNDHWWEAGGDDWKEATDGAEKAAAACAWAQWKVDQAAAGAEEAADAWAKWNVHRSAARAGEEEEEN